MGSLLRQELQAFDPEVPLSDVRSMASVVAGSTLRLTLAAGLAAAVAGLAMLLAAVGIYGLLAYFGRKPSG